MENFKKYKFTSVLIAITLFLFLIFIFLPSRNKIKNVKIKTIESNITMVDIQAYYVKNYNLETYKFTTKEDSYSNLIVSVIENILEKSKLNKNKLSLSKIYFSDNSIYLKFNNKNIDSILKEAIKKTLTGFLGDIEIRFI
ncbi:hypothetical protein [Fusobacterium gastrosuis]|uniref:hypothetical protein n=1 Tax=Fusobacterium gastrosuis TaxID=1755100 RepID=UPI00297B6F47|nr:hypothetical protein [Fusobacteriaceae bacterium]MDY5712586.1 hypothetical protein [Fusobacterium gastrosuis]